MSTVRLRGRALAPLLAASAAMCVASLAAGDTLDPAAVVTLPSGTVIPVTLNAPLSSKSSRAGDRFTATVKYGRDDAGLPEGTRVEGVVREALPAAEGKPGVLDVDFRRIVFPGGGTQPIEASLYSLDGKAVTREDGRLVAKKGSKSQDRLKWIGIGAAGGAVIGALTKGNALVDALLGAAGGYLYNELANKKPGDVNLKQGSEFGVRLDRQLAFTGGDRQFYRGDNGDNRDRADNSGNYYDQIRNRDRGDDRYYNDKTDRTDRTDRGDAYDRNYQRGDRPYDPNYDVTSRRDREDAVSRPREAGDIGMVVDDREIKFDAKDRPYRHNGVVFVPLAASARALGVSYRYATGDRTIYARDESIRLPMDSRIAFVRGERRRLPAAAETHNGVVFVPMELLGWVANGSATWDAGSRTVIVTTDKNRDRR